MEINEKSLKRSRFLYILEAGFEYLISILVAGAYLAKLTESLGMSDQLTGIMSSIISLGHLFQLGSLLMRPKRVKGLVVTFSILNQLLFMMLYVIPLGHGSGSWRSILFVVTIVMAYLLYNLVHPKKTNWFMSLIDDSERGRFTSVKEMVSLIMGVGFTFAMGAVIDHFEAAGQLKTAFIICGATIFLLMVVHTITMVGSVEKPVPVVSGKRKAFAAMLKDKTIMKLAVMFALWYATMYASTPFLGSYLNKELGFSMTFISVLSLIYSGVRIAFSFLWGSYADKKSFKTMLTACLLVSALGYGINIFTVPANGKLFYTAYYVCNAIAMAGTNSALTNLVYDYVDISRRSDAIAITQTVSGVVGFLMTLVMGFLVSFIQRNGNSFFGLSVYAQQVNAAISFVMNLVVILYLQTQIQNKGEKSC
ncbi:MAG: MFS transporter [Clostridia bacterium]|nr:MFS transporter [Clostridia bacterium]